MTFPSRRVWAYAAALTLASGALLVTSESPAAAVSCTSPVRYASSSNTIYLVTAQTFTPTDIKAACPAAPLTLVDAASKTWELSADLVLQNGATLNLHGGTSGDVNTLQIRSLADNAATHVQAITAQYGTLSIDSTHLVSWDDAAGGPDTNPSLPAGAGSTDRGRAFIRALSYLDTDGVTAHESYMYINDSELDHLGYYDSEAYGVAYKTRGCDHTDAGYPVCQKAHVYGLETNSHFHDNFMGTYTWGAYGITFTNDEYDHNVMYGLDPHDVSTYLTIDHNHFDYNGDHGIICSQRCDHLTITNNESDHNGMTPFMGPTGESDTPGQVHGIMIHRGVTNTVISDNYVHDQPNGAGIAVFDSAGDTITNNTVVNAEYGIRLSVGAANNTIRDNTVTNSSQYGLFMYKGTDVPSYTTASGHPTANVFDANTISGTGSNGIKLTEADANQISNCTITNTGGSLLFTNSFGNVLTNDTLDPSQRTSITGSSSEPGSLTMTNPPAPVAVSADTNSSYDVTSTNGQLFTVGSVATTVTPAGSSVHLSSAIVGTTNTVTTTPMGVTVLPASGSATASTTGTGTGTTISLTGAPAGGTIAFTAGGLTAATSYAIRRDGVVIASVTANGGGVISFADAPPTSGSYTYTIAGS